MKISQEVGKGGVLGNIVWGNRGKERRGKGRRGEGLNIVNVGRGSRGFIHFHKTSLRTQLC